MAGSITVSSITLDSDNNFSIRSNTGATILSANGTGLITGIANGASIVSAQLTTPTVSGNLSLDSTGTSGIRLPAANTLAFHTAGSEDMRIDATGNVGIGVTATTQKLYVNGSACFPNDSKLGFHGNPSAATISNYYSGNDTSNYLTMFAGGTERMRIDSSGRVTMPYQPCFHVRLNTGAYLTTSPLPFTNAVFDVGSNFNTSTYRFTAPVAGKYGFLFTGYFKFDANGEYGVFGFRVNASNRTYVEFSAPTATAYASPSITGEYFGGNEECNFYGWLIG